MLSLVETRNRHFMDMCRRVIASIPAGEPIRISEVARIAANQEAPFYYCTYTYALRVLRVMRHGRLTMQNDRRAQMFREILKRCEKKMIRFDCDLQEALVMVLAEGRASQFFISDSTAERLVQRITSERRAMRG